MEEIIESIDEVDWKINIDDYSEFSGFIIKTNKQEIKIGISNGQSCCEHWGYFMSEDSLNDFIGSELLTIVLSDTELNTKLFNEEMKEVYMEECSTMFVNFNTSNGLLQFTAYNSHNGYYGHEATIISKQLNQTEYL